MKSLTQENIANIIISLILITITISVAWYAFKDDKKVIVDPTPTTQLSNSADEKYNRIIPCFNLEGEEIECKG